MLDFHKYLVIASFILLAIRSDLYSAIGCIVASLLLFGSTWNNNLKQAEIDKIKFEIQNLKDKINFNKVVR